MTTHHQGTKIPTMNGQPDEPDPDEDALDAVELERNVIRHHERACLLCGD